MKILALDTSGPIAACALAEDEKLIAGFRLQSGYTHSQTLMPMLEEIRALTGDDLTTVDYVAVASGPGSFTGLRIGASTAKGLCFALRKPLIPVPTLDAIAYRMYGTDKIVCPMLDARRSQVYAAAYAFCAEVAGDKNGDGTVNGAGREDTSGGAGEIVYRMETMMTQCAAPVEEVAQELNRLCEARFGDDMRAGRGDKKTKDGARLILTGDGAPVYLEALRKTLTAPFTVAPFHMDRQSAEAVCALAFRYAREGRAVDAADFAPEYIRSGPKPSERARSEMTPEKETPDQKGAGQ